MAKFQIKQSTYLLRDLKQDDIVYVLMDTTSTEYSFVIDNYLFLSKYLIGFKDSKQINLFFSVTGYSREEFQIIKVQLVSDKLKLISIEENNHLEHLSLDYSTKKFLKDKDYYYIKIETELNSKSFDDLIKEIKEKKEKYIQEVKESMKQEMTIAEEVTSEAGATIAIDSEVQDSEERFSSFNIENINQYEIHVLIQYLEIATELEKWEEAVLLRDEIERR